MTYRDRVRVYFSATGSGFGLTLTNAEMSRGLSIRMDSLSSLLRKMEREGVLGRVAGWGPRGGWGYYWVGE